MLHHTTNGKHPTAAARGPPSPSPSTPRIPPASAEARCPLLPTSPCHPCCPRGSRAGDQCLWPALSCLCPAPSWPHIPLHRVSFSQHSFCPEPQGSSQQGKTTRGQKSRRFRRMPSRGCQAVWSCCIPWHRAVPRARCGCRLRGRARWGRAAGLGSWFLGHSLGSFHAGAGQAGETEPRMWPGAAPTPWWEQGWPGAGGGVARRGGE